MDQEPQVFSSNITRSAKPLKNDLTDLLNITPAQPVVQKKYETRNTCDYTPKGGKSYEPKRKSKLKVSTVRDIRKLFENDVYSTLHADLEKQQNFLLRKIKAGSARDENTKVLAQNMMKCDKPVSRAAWQMITNLNPEEYSHPTQFVLWNGKRIRVNGSKGGACKFMFKYDIGSKQLPKKAKSLAKYKPMMKNRGLLQNSLSINFKPGPLRKKKYLDLSYQKYNVGGIELQNLPRAALEICPKVGKIIDPNISRFIQNMPQADGTISEKWAEFSVSVLATIKNDTITQIENDCYVTFGLNYKCEQQRILMRRDISSEFSPFPLKNQHGNCDAPQDSVTESVIKNLLDKIIDSVEISIEQDNMYTGEEEPRVVKTEEHYANGTKTHSKESRLKELERLDVTIIRLAESVDKKTIVTCPKAHCSLGCVCPSLDCGYNLKTHCGRLECMFECKCDFSKFRVVDSFERDCSDLLPGLLKLDSEMSSKMAKEEQKFHHTVIVTPENSMLLKSKRRSKKSSRKYADFFSNMSQKSDEKKVKEPTIVLDKLNLANVEPWCIVHSLYKCFCKGVFTASSIGVNNDESKEMNAVEPPPKGNIEQNVDLENTNIRSSVRTRIPTNRNVLHNNQLKDKSTDRITDNGHLYNMVMGELLHDYKCARVNSFKGRKYTDEYYFSANRKIAKMEEHDNSLRKRLTHLFNVSTSFIKDQVSSNEIDNSDASLPKLVPPTPELPPLPPLTSAPTVKPITLPDNKTLNTRINLFTNRLPDKQKLVAWLENSYKQYKERINRGILKITLEPPHHGKMALYPWEFILGRYREKKNLFLITTKMPYRIFMAVDPQNPFFRQCININDIRFADLAKYPVTVKNLLANAKDLKDNFCILWGLSHCWEVIGSVTKVDQPKEMNESVQDSDEEQNKDIPETMYDTFHGDSEDSNAAGVSVGKNQEGENMSLDITTDDSDKSSDDSSRWFVMTVENDFNEIQFYKKGFFVKLESITKAIIVARASKKTVRLSSQKCVENNSGPQFGIYAIPNENESCVFVGPYEKDEPLGIETIKNISDIRKQNRTKGVWITTKKLENFNVIDNPLSFMPPKNVSESEMMTLAGDSASTVTGIDSSVPSSTSKNEVANENPEKRDSKKTKLQKVLKPIKICKTNFFQLAPNGTIKPISHHDDQPKIINRSLLNLAETPFAPLLGQTSSVLKAIPNSKVTTKVVTIHKRPVAEIAPHVKQSNQCSKILVTSLESICKDEPPKKEKGMFILKPEEINKRLMQSQVSTNLEHFNAHEFGSDTKMDPDIEMDIENFLATAEECEAPNDDVFIISDDELESPEDKKLWIDVWIECKTIEGLGWIRGRKLSNGSVSFEFPGFKYTEFYGQEEAFAKLTQVFSRRIYVPKSIHLEWHLVESERDLHAKHMLTQEELGPDFIMTKRGIRHKQELKNTLSSKKVGGKESELSNSNTLDKCDNEPLDNMPEPMDIDSLEAQSQLLDEEAEVLMDKLKSTAGYSAINEGLREVDDIREKIAARLKSMVSDK